MIQYKNDRVSDEALLRRYSSRREKLVEAFLNNKLKGAKAYDRIAGYFSSSILKYLVKK